MQTHRFDEFPLPPVEGEENVRAKAHGEGHVEDIQGPRAQLGGIVPRQPNRGLPSLIGNRAKLKDSCGRVLFKASTHCLCFAQRPQVPRDQCSGLIQRRCTGHGLRAYRIRFGGEI